jgi:cellulose synthase/poly-beta-1,6-N-acetylglucosamine synthase-like glycosyltransferase
MTGRYLWFGFEWLFFGYFMLLYAVYAMLNVFAVIQIRRYLQVAEFTGGDNVFSSLDLPISVIVPAYNESASIVTSIRAMLQLEYPLFEIVVVNDGSTDDTLEKILHEFSMHEFPEAYRNRVPCQPVRGMYRSPLYPTLRIVDKVNGGSKADAMNAGINAARYPIFCAVDADSILQLDSLRRAVRPFLEDPDTVAAGGTVRIANGCNVRGGFLEGVALPRNPLALIQVIEYLRAFLYGRMGWTHLNAVLIVSGAFGVFDKEVVVRAGGYRPDAVGEDMELIVRLHKLMRAAGRRYRITFVPDPICWTDAPEDLESLRKQRIRWHHGLAQCLSLHRSLFFDRRGGTVSWMAMPFFLLFELLAPVVEFCGFVILAVGTAFGWIPWETAAAFLCLSIGLGLLLSASALVLEELSFHVYPRLSDLLMLFVAAIIENLGYRQLTVIWRLRGLANWMRGRTPVWGVMKRSSSLSHR